MEFINIHKSEEDGYWYLATDFKTKNGEFQIRCNNKGEAERIKNAILPSPNIFDAVTPENHPHLFKELHRVVKCMI